MTIEERLEALERKAFPERFCEHEWHQGPVPCPDGKVGCLVYHVGVLCWKCYVTKSKWDAGEYAP